MNKQIIKNADTGESYIRAKHKSGLDIYICEKHEFSTAYAIFGTRYGSVDNSFRKIGESDFTRVPNGIAHFLEHKLFESEDGDAFSRYAKTGAAANAYTSFDRTCYLFTCTGNFDDSFDILLDFVQHPYFTAETVAKEQGIIGQEIRMYDDSPDWMLLFNLLSCLYYNNPVKINIAGTEKTIAEITDKLLYKCYETFYNPSNMFIVVSGNVDADRVLKKIDESLKDREAVKFEREEIHEPDGIVCGEKRHEMAVSLPQFALGYKINTPKNGYLDTETVVETQMLTEIIAGKQSRLFESLLEKGYINKGFSSELMEGRGFAIGMFSGQSAYPEQVAEEIKGEISRLQTEGIDEDDFKSVQRMFYGRSVMMFNDVEGIGDALTGAACSESGLFDELDVIKNVTADKLIKRLGEQFAQERSALSIILPKR